MRKIRIHKEGYRFVVYFASFLVIVNLICNAFLIPSLIYLVSTVSVISFLFVLYFFRNPKFVPEIKDENLIVAPADGTIVVLEEVEEPEYFKDKRMQVSIFMSPTNVHVNRNPIDGQVVYTKYHPGNYYVAWHPKSSTLNERFTSVIQTETEEVEILVRQIAGKVARKITNYLEEGENVIQGTELGFIKFGSRIDLFLPLGTSIKVNLKDKVKAGATVIAAFKED